MIRADLHLHTVYSDGACTPEELAAKVKSAGLQLFALTDHDSMEGVSRGQEAAAREGLLFVSGWEVSAYLGEVKVHVLGYGCKRNGAYFSFLQDRITGGYLRAEDALKKANAYFGTKVTMRDIEALHTQKDAPLHTMHVVRAFSMRLHRPLRELYHSVFAAGGPAYSDIMRPTPEEAIEIIHATEGIAVLAHPSRIKLEGEERDALINRLVTCGLNGIECVHTSHTERESAIFRAYAEERGLLVTGGSDFHVDGTPRILGQPPFYADEALLKAFRLA